MTKLKKQRKFEERLAKVTHFITSEQRKQATWTAADKLNYILTAPEDVRDSKERWKLLFELDLELFERGFSFRMRSDEVQNKLGWDKWSQRHLYHLPKIPNLTYHPGDFVPALLLEIYYMPMTGHAKGILRTSPLLPKLKEEIAEHGRLPYEFPCTEPYQLHHDYQKMQSPPLARRSQLELTHH